MIRPSAAIAPMNGCRSWVTDSSPAMKLAASVQVIHRSGSDSAAKSRASWVKSMSAGFQCRALPLANSRMGNESNDSRPSSRLA